VPWPAEAYQSVRVTLAERCPDNLPISAGSVDRAGHDKNRAACSGLPIPLTLRAFTALSPRSTYPAKVLLHYRSRAVPQVYYSSQAWRKGADQS